MQGITWLLQIVMFLTLGLLVNPKEMLNVMLVAVSIGLFMMFVARPIAVFLCLQPFRVPFKAKVFLSWVGLRGAVPIIFATYPVIAGIEDADFLFNVVFVITLLSLALQGTTITAAARSWYQLCVFICHHPSFVVLTLAKTFLEISNNHPTFQKVTEGHFCFKKVT